MRGAHLDRSLPATGIYEKAADFPRAVKADTPAARGSVLPPRAAERLVFSLVASWPHVVVEQIVGHLRAAHHAPLEIESIMNATPNAAVRLVVAEL